MFDKKYAFFSLEMRKNICILISRRTSGNGNGKNETVTENLKSKLGLAGKNEKFAISNLSRVASGKFSSIKNSENWRFIFRKFIIINISNFYFY